MKIVFATNNAHKLSEVQAVLGDAFTLLTPRDCGVEEDIPEEQQTLEGNASQKSHYLHGRTGLDCFADDTGLEVEALGGAPGVHSARYATDGHDFAANNRLLLKNLEGAENRRARFRTVISLILGGEEHLFEGVVEGRIIDREAGHEGFGYDPLFIPDGYAKTFAEMTTDEKNAVSHRAQTGRIPPFDRKIAVWKTSIGASWAAATFANARAARRCTRPRIPPSRPLCAATPPRLPISPAGTACRRVIPTPMR